MVRVEVFTSSEIDLSSWGTTLTVELVLWSGGGGGATLRGAFSETIFLVLARASAMTVLLGLGGTGGGGLAVAARMIED